MAGASFMRALMKQSSWYFICNALNNGLAIILLPFLSRYLSTEEYGIVQLSTGIGLFLPMLFCGGIDKAIYRFYHEFNDKKKSELVSTIFWFVVTSGFIILSLFVLSSGLCFERFLHIPAYPYSYLFAYPYLFLQIATIGLSVCQQTFNLKTMTIIEVVGTSINLFCSILFVLYVFDDGAFARLLAISLSYVFKAAAYILLLLKFRLLKLRISFRLIKSSVSYSLPLLPNSIALWLIRTFDRVLVSYFCGPAICGEYSVGVQISFVVYFIQDSVMQALGPLQIQSFIDDKIAALKRLFSLSHMLWLMMGFMTFLYCTVVPELMNIFLDHKFVPNYLTVIFLTCVYIFQAQYRLFSDVLSFHKVTKWFMYAAVVQAAIGLLLNFILIPSIGYVGAGISNCVSVITYTLIIIFASKRYEEIDVNWKFYLSHLSFWVISFGVSYFFIDNILIKYSYLSIFIIIYLRSLYNEIKNRHIVIHLFK